MSPAQRSLQLLRSEGFTVERVEQRLPRCGITRDLFGVGDLLAARPGELLLVQVTSASNLAARRRKALAAPGLRTWLQAGGRFELHAWGKRGPRGGRKRWDVRRETVALGDLVAGQGNAITGNPG
jgi:hypothetical protein